MRSYIKKTLTTFEGLIISLEKIGDNYEITETSKKGVLVTAYSSKHTAERVFKNKISVYTKRHYIGNDRR